MHDPFQNYQTLGAYGINPAALGGYPLTATPGIGAYGMHPQQFQGAGIGAQQGSIPQGVGWNPITAGLQNPLLQNPILQNPLLQNPLLQNPLLQTALLQNPMMHAGWQNPLIGGLTNPLLNPMLAQHGWPQQQFGYPQQTGYPQQQFGYPQQTGYPQQQFGYPQHQQFGHLQQQFGYPLAPQSLIGAGNPYGGQAFGQLHPIIAAQLALRTLTPPGISPWTGF